MDRSQKPDIWIISNVTVHLFVQGLREQYFHSQRSCEIYIAPWGMRRVYLIPQSHKQASLFQFCRFKYVFGNCLMNFSCHYKAWYTYSIGRHPRQVTYPCPIGSALKECVCMSLWSFYTIQGHWIHENPFLPLTQANGLKKYIIKDDIVNRLSSEKS